MPKKGLVFLYNDYPKSASDNFIHKKIYRFIPVFGHKIVTFIELEIHANQIVVISFYSEKHKNNKNKYKIRSNIGPGHTRAIMRACLEAYYELDCDYAFVFNASNDVDEKGKDKNLELNARYSAYELFLSISFKDYDNYIKRGSIAINTLILFHQSFQYKDEANRFYDKFELEVEERINNPDTDADK